MSVTKRLVADWQEVRDKLEKEAWARQIVDRIKPETDRWIAHYADDADRIAGWGHHYFCDKCFAALQFDMTKPNEHVCTGCGKRRVAPEADEAWCTIYRGRACGEVLHAAVFYKLYGDPEYLAYIRKVLRFLSDHYGHFQVRTPPGQEGRFSGTDLTDGVSIIGLLNGMELVRDEFTTEELAYYKERFFIPMADFLIVKRGCTPNIICWMKAAAGMIGLYFHEPIWCERAAEGEDGLKKRLADGLLPEGFWYEASFVYHFYCAEGPTYYLAFCQIYNYDFPEMEDAIRKMYRYPTRYAFPNGQFPSPSDGWPMLTFGKYAHQYEWIRNLFDEEPYRFALAQCYNRTLPKAGLHKHDHDQPSIGGLPRLLFGRNWEAEWNESGTHGKDLPDSKSQFDPDIHFAMLRSGDAAVFLKYGFTMRGHSHADAMNIEIFKKDEVISHDISNSGYASDLFREWQRKTIAHNSVMIDMENQPNRPKGRMAAFDADDNRCVAVVEDIYPGVDFTRALQLTADCLRDEFTVTANPERGERTVDWLFHCSGELNTNLPFEAAERPGESDGYQLMEDVASWATDVDWELTWVLPDKQLTLRMEGEPGTVITIFKGYEHRLDWTRWGVMVRRQALETTYKASYHLKA